MNDNIIEKILEDYCRYKVKEKLGQNCYKDNKEESKILQEQMKLTFLKLIKDDNKDISEAKEKAGIIIREAQQERIRLIESGKEEVNKYKKKTTKELYTQYEKNIKENFKTFIIQGVIFAGIMGLLVNQVTENLQDIKYTLVDWTNSSVPYWGFTVFFGILMSGAIFIYLIAVWFKSLLRGISKITKDTEVN